ncbi:MAG: DNA repair protein RecN [Blastocatellales bacterium]
MLRFLNIANFALIDSLQIEFQPGLNVLSGETGSGKSIIIDALGLLLGERGSQDVIRTGETKSIVEGVFDCQGNEPLIDLLSEAGIGISDEDLIVKREVNTNGRGRIFINNQLATLGLLRAIQPHIIDIHGQGDQQSLLSPENHLNLLDSFAGTMSQRLEVARAYDDLLRLVKEMESSRQNESERLKSLDVLEFQLSEIEQVNLSPNEDIELESERNLLASAEKLSGICADAYQNLYEDENSVLARISLIHRRISDLAGLDPTVAPQLEQLSNAKYILDDISFFLSEYLSNIQASPEHLQAIEDRLTDIYRLKRKYGGSVAEILATYDKLLEQKSLLLHSEETGLELEQRLRSSINNYQDKASDLSEMRRRAAVKLEKAVAKELADVALGPAKFSLRLQAQTVSQLSERIYSLINLPVDFIGRSGKENSEFFFTANVGEDLKPLKSVASGGELSRLMLVLKTIIAPTLFPRTLIFDEIDSGIGGRVAEAVGLRLRKLAKSNQVLCITHQPQIARYADAHYLVSKEVSDKRTVTRLTQLDQDGRVDELVRMIGGSNVTTAARKHARELIESQ